MKTFIAILTIASLALASDCPKGTTKCAYNTTTSKVYAQSCYGKQITGELKASTCSGSPTIANCLKTRYKSDTDKTVECDGCEDGYEEHNNTCVKCEYKKGYMSNGTCTPCDGATKYVNQGQTTTCTDRTNTNISGCESYSYYSDTCGTCKSGKDKYDSGKKCGDLPANCSSLDNSKTTIECDGCKAGYWLDGTTCKAPTTAVANCEVYKNGTECWSCKQGYMKKAAENVCNKEIIPYCSGYNQAEDKCGSCYNKNPLKTNYQLTTDATACVDTFSCSNPVFAATGKEFKCKTCRSPAYWATDVIGTAEETDSNSLKYWNQKCTKGAAAKTIFALFAVAFAILF